MHELALFAGAGGGILAGRLLGWRTIAACEIEPYPRAVLLHNQKLGNLPHFPIWDDIRTLDATPFRGHIDIVTGGFPCQDISAAGKGAGITGTRSGLWSEMHRIIREVQPRYAYMENSPMLTSRGLGRVLGDLAEIGYHAAWLVLGAADCGAPHIRNRIWILAENNGRRDMADTAEHRLEESRNNAGADTKTKAGRSADKSAGTSDTETNAPHTHCPQRTGNGMPLRPTPQIPGPRNHGGNRPARHPWSFEPNVGRVAHGVASRVDRLKALGNGQVPLVAATAFQILKQRLDNIQP